MLVGFDFLSLPRDIVTFVIYQLVPSLYLASVCSYSPNTLISKQVGGPLS